MSTEQERYSRRDVLRLGLAGAAAVAVGEGVNLAGGAVASEAGATAVEKIKRGGTLRVGITGGTLSDTLDADNAISAPDFARAQNLFSPLMDYNADNKLTYYLAKSIESDKSAKIWTIPLRQGVLFSNGKEMTAADVVFTLQRILNPKNGEQGLYSGLGPIIPSSIRALNKFTVRLETNVPYSSLPQQIAAYHTLVVPVGYKVSHPVGTGPFVLKSFTPNAQTVLTRNKHYYKKGLPYVDEVILTEYSDFDAQINALLSNQVDVIAAIPPSAVPALKGQSGVNIFAYSAGLWNPFTMRYDKPPFNDNRVREAFRLIVNRPQVIESAFDGFAVLGNDVSAQFDPADYDYKLPQRKQDIGKAKSLLKSAGHENLTVPLIVLPALPGCLESAEVFQQNAKLAGVHINLVQPDPTTFDNKYYGNSLLSQDNWPFFQYLSQAAQAFLPTSPYNATHFADRQYAKLNAQANATTNNNLRKELMYEMQKIEYARGTYVIPSFNKVIDAYHSNVHGLVGWKTGYPVNSCHFESIWLS